ncbi:MAG: ribbon-helix-helix protein, CopG family [Desulfurococcales archaeon]|nr:ribbon-helix-helix protein, CopG family [Desulfurococcales archaeon]
MSATVDLLLIYEPPRQEKARVVTFKVTPQELERIDRAARLLGISRSELIRLALDKLITELEHQG